MNEKAKRKRKRQEAVQARELRDEQYRAALGVRDGEDLPRTVGQVAPSTASSRSRYVRETATAKRNQRQRKESVAHVEGVTEYRGGLPGLGK